MTTRAAITATNTEITFTYQITHSVQIVALNYHIQTFLTR